MQRRQFFQWAGGLTAALLVVGCGDGGDALVVTSNGSQPRTSTVLGRLVPEGAIEALTDDRLVELRPGSVSVFSADGALQFRSQVATLPIAAVGDAAGRLFVLDRGEGRVNVLRPDGGLESTFGEGLQGFIDLALANGEVFLLDAAGQSINVYTTAGVFVREFRVGLDKAHLRAIAAGPSGDLYVLISNPVSVVVVSSSGETRSSYAPPEGVAQNARGLAVNSSGRSAILDHVGYQVLLFDESNEFVEALTIPDSDGDISQPLTVGLGSDGQVHASFTEVFA